ncbi:hypothetical protein [Metallibacterium sp.]|uniref:hypothetical protein n=1 Tax=Metallibacterium sp. TaxID=2940281 RepID=UPI00262607F2|nr:hypothetical protein [Metallibacterium sp.]
MSDPAPSRGPAYTTHIGDCARDREVVLGIWRDNLGRPARHTAKFDWFYLGNPCGAPLLTLLRHEAGPTWIGTCAAGPRRMLWRGREIRAGVLVDMAVSAQHRTLGPALMMQFALIEAAADCFELIYGFPNPKSLAVARRLDYTVIDELVRYVRVLRHRRYLERVLPRWPSAALAWLLDTPGAARRAMSRGVRAAWLDQADARMDALWQASRHGPGPLTIRDTAFLRWRFETFRAVQTRYLLISPARESGPPLAWFACQILDGTLHVRDFWSSPGTGGLPRAAAIALLRAARGADCHAVSIEYAGLRDAVATLHACGFRERGRRPMIVRWIGAGNAGPSPHFPHLTAADEDE